MPVGIIINSLSILVGGIAGALFGHLLGADFKEKLNMVFGCCSMAMGVSSIVLMENMPAVVFSVIVGTVIGLAIHLGEWINKGAVLMQRGMSKFITPKSDMPEADFTATLVTCIVLFCASGTGVYGSMVSGMTGDHSILIAKSVLDFFTAIIFACNLGYVVSAVAIPQSVVFLTLFLLADFIFPLTNATMINDFKACGGFIMLATGFRMMRLKLFPVADMIPAMVLVMPISRLWVECINPFVASLAG